MAKSFRIFTKIYKDGEFKIVSREKLFETIQEKELFSVSVNGLTENGWENIEKTYGKSISSPDAIKDIIKHKMSQYSKNNLCENYDIEIIA